MSEYEVVLTHTTTQTLTFIVKGTGEQAVEKAIQAQITKYGSDIDALGAFHGVDWEIEEENLQIEEINEA